MFIEITGLHERDQLRIRAERLLHDVLERRRAFAVRAAFFDDDGPRDGVAIRCALTVTPSRGPIVRVEHTARTHSAALNGGVEILKRRLKRGAERSRRRTRFPRGQWSPRWEAPADTSGDSSMPDAAA
jgi:hypothetical protein